LVKISSSFESSAEMLSHSHGSGHNLGLQLTGTDDCVQTPPGQKVQEWTSCNQDNECYSDTNNFRIPPDCAQTKACQKCSYPPKTPKTTHDAAGFEWSEKPPSVRLSSFQS